MLESETAHKPPEHESGETMTEIAQNLWEQEQAKVARLQSEGAKALFSEIPDIQENFRLHEREVRCIDEGVSDDGVHVAGSGCLIPEDELVAQLKELATEGRITAFTTHENCGAWGVRQATNPTTELQQEWGSRIAKLAGLPYRHIPGGEMPRDPQVHHAKVIYYAGTDFRKESEDLPDGFILNRNAFPSTRDDMGLTIEIIKGDHGVYGPHGQTDATAKNIIIVPIGDPQNPEFSLKNLTAEAEAVAEQYRTDESPITVTGANALSA